MSEDKYEPSAYGANLWFRSVALKKMLSYGFKIDDFKDATPDKDDGTLSHTIERIYGLAAQDSGYFLAYTLSDVQARSEIINYQSMLFGNTGIIPLLHKHIPFNDISYNGILLSLEQYMRESAQLSEDFRELSNQMQPPELYKHVNAQDYLETISIRLLFKKLAKRLMPKFIWKFIAGR